MDMKQLEQTSRDFFNSLNNGDIEGWLKTLAKDALSYEPVGTPPNEGHEGLLQWLENMGQPFESFHTDVKEVFVAGNDAAIRWTAVGKLKSGQEINLSGIDVHEYNEDGQIQTVKGYFDPSPIMAGMGS